MPRKNWPSAADALEKIGHRVEILTRGYIRWENPPAQLAEKIAFVCMKMRVIHVVVSDCVVNRHAWYTSCQKLESGGIYVTFDCENVYSISTTCNNSDFKIVVLSEDERGFLSSPAPNCIVGVGVTPGNESNWLRQKVLQCITDWLN